MNLLEKAKLVDMDFSHLETVLKWRNQKHIREVMFNDRIIMRDEHYNWFRKISLDGNSFHKIFLLNNTPTGVVNITRIDRLSNKCEWGFYIGDVNAPRGSGTLMGILTLDFIFQELKIRKLCSEIIGFNAKSISYHKKLGFTEEGALRADILKDNKYVDVILMALFKEKWEKQKSQLYNGLKGRLI